MRTFAYVMLYVLLWPLNIVLVLLAYLPMSFVLATLAVFIGPVIPVPLRWFSTLNASLDGYKEQGVPGYDYNATGFKLWWQRVCWTCRNPCNGFQSQVYGVSDVTKAFTLKKDIPLTAGWYIKCWLGWNDNMRGGDYYPYMFQFWPKRKKE